jgi:hypothetical protein
MSEIYSEPAPKPKKDLAWGAACVMVSISVNVTIDKYGSQWNGWIVAMLWSLALIPCLIWLWHNERLLLTRGWIAGKFKQHPISYSIVLAMFGFIAWNAGYHLSTRQWKRPATEQTATTPKSPPLPARPSEKQIQGATVKPATAPTTKAKNARSPKLPVSLAPITVTASDRPAIITGGVKQGGDGGCQQNVIGGSNNINNCPPKEVTISDAQTEATIKRLKETGVTGSVEIDYEMSTENGPDLASKLKQILDANGITAAIGERAVTLSCGGAPMYAGISFCNVTDNNSQLANAIGRSLIESHVVDQPLRAVGSTNGQHGDLLIIFIRKP